MLGMSNGTFPRFEGTSNRIDLQENHEHHDSHARPSLPVLPCHAMRFMIAMPMPPKVRCRSHCTHRIEGPHLQTPTQRQGCGLDDRKSEYVEASNSDRVLLAQARLHENRLAYASLPAKHTSRRAQHRHQISLGLGFSNHIWTHSQASSAQQRWNPSITTCLTSSSHSRSCLPNLTRARNQ